MTGTWQAGIAELKSLTEFLEGTGVMACAYSRANIEVGDITLEINSRRDESGDVSYFVDEYGE